MKTLKIGTYSDFISKKKKNNWIQQFKFEYIYIVYIYIYWVLKDKDLKINWNFSFSSKYSELKQARI